MKVLKNFIIRLLRTYGPSQLNHYLWPKRLHSRMLDWNMYYHDQNKIRINFGAGPYFEKKGWLSVDFINPNEINISNTKENYKQIDISKVQDFNLGKIDISYASHFCEHLNLNDLKKFLTNVSNNTKKGGILRIVVPDSDLVLNRLKENDLELFRPFAPVLRDLYNLEFNSVNVANLILNQYALTVNDQYRLQLSDITSYMANSPSILNKINSLNSSKENKFTKNEIVELGRLHMTALNFNILSEELIKAGFTKVVRSAFMQSMAPEMREVPIFDGTHPWFSLYVEAIK